MAHLALSSLTLPSPKRFDSLSFTAAAKEANCFAVCKLISALAGKTILSTQPPITKIINPVQTILALPPLPWLYANITWCMSEAAALKRESFDTKIGKNLIAATPPARHDAQEESSSTS